MRNLIRVAGALALVAVVSTGCDKLKKKGAGADAGAEEAGAVAETSDAAAATTPAAGPIAANVDDIARFPDETKLDNVAANTLRFSSVRETPALGKIVAQLAAGTAVTKIAERTTFFLVTFDKPGDPSKKLMGWLTADAFSPPADAGLKAIKCTAPEVALLGDQPFCGQPCTKDADCPAGKACKGAAQKFTNGKVGENVQACTVFSTIADAGAPAAVDAGVAAHDAGAAPADAGAVVAQGDIIDVPANAPCPRGFFLVQKDHKCHRSCPSGIAPKDCSGGSPFCGKCDGAKVCNAVRDFCK